MNQSIFRRCLPALLLGLSLTSCTDVAETAQDTEISVTESPVETTSPDAEESNTESEEFGSFTATTLTGETISDSIFQEYDVTMVNIWATWCSPCVKEMPYLQEVYESLPDNINMFTICQDAESQMDLLQQILSTSGATFDTIIPSNSIYTNILPKITAFPTTLFVDRNGDVVTLVMGAPPSQVTETYLYYIDLVLEFLEGES